MSEVVRYSGMVESRRKRWRDSWNSESRISESCARIGELGFMKLEVVESRESRGSGVDDLGRRAEG